MVPGFEYVGFTLFSLIGNLGYSQKHGKDKDLSRVILLTPNERLSEQHIAEFRESDISASNFANEGFNLFTLAQGLNRVDVLEITKLADQEGPNTIATRSLVTRTCYWLTKATGA